MSNNKVIDGLYYMYLESQKMDITKKNPVIDEMYELYTKGVKGNE
jgi:hypothetical protein